MANGQKHARKEKDNGKIIPIDGKLQSGNGKGKPRPAPLFEAQKDIENELAALDKKSLLDIVEIAVYPPSKEVRKKALGLVAKEKNVSALKTILHHPGLQDPESEIIALIDAFLAPKPSAPDEGSA